MIFVPVHTSALSEGVSERHTDFETTGAAFVNVLPLASGDIGDDGAPTVINPTAGDIAS
jgi:hypothetical protein